MRNSSSALPMSPPASVSAFLHSIMPSPVRWRSSITMLAEMSAIRVVLALPRKKGRSRRPLHIPLDACPGRVPSGRRLVRNLDELVAALHDLGDRLAATFEHGIRRAARVQADRAAAV